MDEVVVRRWCDLCRVAESGKRVEAPHRYVVTIAMGKGGRRPEPRTVDCCDKHARQLDELSQVVRQVGFVTEPRPGAEEGCPVCGKQMEDKSVTPHLVKVHGARMPKQPAKCPDCGRTTTVGTDAAMVMHRKVHGYDPRQAVIDTLPKKARGGA